MWVRFCLDCIKNFYNKVILKEWVNYYIRENKRIENEYINCLVLFFIKKMKMVCVRYY